MIWHHYYHRFLQGLTGVILLALLGIALGSPLFDWIGIGPAAAGLIVGLIGFGTALLLERRSKVFLETCKAMPEADLTHTRISLDAFHLEAGSYLATGLHIMGLVYAWTRADGLSGNLSLALLCVMMAGTIWCALRTLFRIIDAHYLIRHARK